MRPIELTVLFTAALTLLGVVRPALARERGTVLPELSGRAVGPAADPRRERSRRLRSRDRDREVRKRHEPRYPSERMRDGTIRFRAPGWFAFVAPDGSVRFRRRRASWHTSKASLSFDVTDDVMRRGGKDPYAMQKLRFLRSTRRWRTRLRRRARLGWRQRYFATLPARLRALWARRDVTTAGKRRLLYALWQECLEPGDSPLRRRAQQARWMILRFVARTLPAGSPQGFTPAELSRLNARRRGQPAFDPYGHVRRPLPPGRRHPRHRAA